VLDPRAWIGLLRLVHFYNYSHVAPRRAVRLGLGVRLSPAATFRNPTRVEIGPRTHIGEGCQLWAGNTTGRVVIGADCLLAPDVFVTASNYGSLAARPILSQPRLERDVRIGDGVWLGARVIVLAGVRIGDGRVIRRRASATRAAGR
jgi:acetyltransferase-like isoleucine patch superfamily enzyme